MNIDAGHPGVANGWIRSFGDNTLADISEAGYEWCRPCQEWHLPEEHSNA